MKCPHCNEGTHRNFQHATYLQAGGKAWAISSMTCPGCQDAIIELAKDPTSALDSGTTIPTGITLLLSHTVALGQHKTGNATANGNCSIAISGNNNTVLSAKELATACALPKGQLDQIVKLLNKILTRNYDFSVINARIDELERDNTNLLTYGSPTHGELVPGNFSDPPLPPDCAPPPGSIKVFLGGSVQFADKSEPMIQAIHAGATDYVGIERKDNGILINAFVTGPDGRAITEIKNNKFVSSQAATFDRTISADHTTLEVRDDRGQYALVVKFLNPQAIQVSGRFRSSGGMIDVRDDSVFYESSRNKFTGSCGDGLVGFAAP